MQVPLGQWGYPCKQWYSSTVVNITQGQSRRNLTDCNSWEQDAAVNPSSRTRLNREAVSVEFMAGSLILARAGGLHLTGEGLRADVDGVTLDDTRQISIEFENHR